MRVLRALIAAAGAAATCLASPAAPQGADAIARGERAFRICRACHQIGEGARNGVGPALNGVVGRTVGAAEDFRYSSALRSRGEEGMVWTEEALLDYLENPRAAAPGTNMAFAGVRRPEDRAAIVEFLKSIEAAPQPPEN